jgi:hypothetical protein
LASDVKRILATLTREPELYFSAAQADLIRSAIKGLIRADTEKPGPLYKFNDSFRGGVNFRYGRARISISSTARVVLERHCQSLIFVCNSADTTALNEAPSAVESPAEQNKSCITDSRIAPFARRRWADLAATAMFDTS